jgi:hypothetical protein
MSRGAATQASVHRAVPSRGNAREHAIAPQTSRSLGGSNQLIQAKLQIGPVDDPLEREADRAADAVLTGASPPSLGKAPGGLQSKCAACAANEDRNIQRKCAECEAEEQGTIQRRAAENAGSGALAASVAGAHTVTNGADVAATAIANGGAPLSRDVRSYFEPRFGRNFSRVRVHTGGDVDQAAHRINARAFTAGRDIGFASGEYAPDTRTGRSLIAHELAHVVQQVPFIARQTAPYYTRTFEDRAGGGTTDYTETVQIAPVKSGNVITGSVDRSEVAPAAGGQPQQTISSGRIDNISLDTSTCILTVPYKFNFIQQPTAPAPFCDDPAPSKAVQPLSAAQMQELQDKYINSVNTGINNWYRAKIEGCEQPCADKPIPIKIDAKVDSSSPDKIINVVNRSGRGNAGTICVGDFSPGFATHESGHQILKMGDEYREDNPGLRQKNPNWARDERVRTDLTRMGSDSKYGRFSLFHERHFRFAQVFLEAIFKSEGCSVRLDAEPKSIPDFRIQFDFGYVPPVLGGSYLTLGGGIGMGLPLDRQRHWETILGLQGQYFTGSSYPQSYRDAFLIGARAGLEARTSPGSVAATFDLYAGGGALHQFEKEGSLRGTAGLPAKTSGYGEVGLGIGVTSGMLGSGVAMHAGVEASLGSELSRDQDAMRWLRLGFNLGASF